MHPAHVIQFWPLVSKSFILKKNSNKLTLAALGILWFYSPNTNLPRIQSPIMLYGWLLSVEVWKVDHQYSKVLWSIMLFSRKWMTWTEPLTVLPSTFPRCAGFSLQFISNAKASLHPVNLTVEWQWVSFHIWLHPKTRSYRDHNCQPIWRLMYPDFPFSYGELGIRNKQKLARSTFLALAAFTLVLQNSILAPSLRGSVEVNVTSPLVIWSAVTCHMLSKKVSFQLTCERAHTLCSKSLG